MSDERLDEAMFRTPDDYRQELQSLINALDLVEHFKPALKATQIEAHLVLMLHAMMPIKLSRVPPHPRYFTAVKVERCEMCKREFPLNNIDLCRNCYDKFYQRYFDEEVT